MRFIYTTLLACTLMHHSLHAGVGFLDDNAQISQKKLASMNDETFYHVYGELLKVPYAETLKNNPDIQSYPFERHKKEEKPILSEEEIKTLHKEFAIRRIWAKKNEEGASHPGLTDEAVSFMQKDEEFLSHFATFLEALSVVEFYSNLANEAVNASRGAKNPDGSLGMPKITQDIRSKNQSFVTSLDGKKDKLYSSIETHLSHTEKACQNGQSFPRFSV